MIRRPLLILLALLAIVVPVRTQSGGPVAYDIVYVRSPRTADRVSKIAEVANPLAVEPGTDLMLLRADGREEVLLAGGVDGAVFDPCVSFDGRTVYAAYGPNVRALSPVTYPAVPAGNIDIVKIDVATKQVTPLTHGEYQPVAADLPKLPYGTFYTSPCPLADGRIVFTSNRQGLVPPHAMTPVTMQLFTMNADGSDVEAIAPMTLGSALHPFQLTDGRIAFSTAESQGLRISLSWAYWAIWPDGTTWEPLWSGFTADKSLHWAGQTSNSDLVIAAYYNQNNAGFGSLLRFPVPVRFGSPMALENTGVTQTHAWVGGRVQQQWPFMPIGASSPTPWLHGEDTPAPKDANGQYVGKVTQPTGAPNGDLLLVYSAGGVNVQVGLATIDAGIYRLPQGTAMGTPQGISNSPSDLVLIKNDPAYHELQPKPLVPYRAIYGIDAPRVLPTLANDGTTHASLPAGTAYGIVGTSSVYKRESAPGSFRAGLNQDGQEIYDDKSNSSSNWIWQGSDAGVYTNADIDRMRIVVMEPRPSGREIGFIPTTNERLRVLGEIPLRKSHPDGTPIRDAEGNPDTSFWAKIPADTPFTFQLIDSHGRQLTMAQTWHQVRPGEVRVDCGGCHSHSQTPLNFETTAAAKLSPTDLTLQPAHDVEFIRDVRPILQAKCVTCHTGASAPANLRFDDLATDVVNGLAIPRDYAVLGWNRSGERGGTRWASTLWQPNLSVYVRTYQSRRSLLVWKLAGQRLDGWTNSQWSGDMDYADTANHQAITTAAEQRTIATWIDLGAPVATGTGYFRDDTKPALAITATGQTVTVGASDAYAGINATTLTASINGTPIALAPLSDGRWTAPLPAGASTVTASVQDRAGNRTTLTKRLTGTAPPLPPQLPAPTNLRFEAGFVISSAPTQLGFPLVRYPRVLWNAVPGAVAYEVTMTWSSGRIIAQMPVMGLNGFPLPLGMPGHQYRVSVRACTVLPPAACDGAVSPTIVVER